MPGVGFADLVTEVAVEAKRRLLRLRRFRVAAGEPVHGPQLVPGAGFAGPVAEVLRGPQRGGVPGQCVGPGPVVAQQAGDRGGQGHDPGVLVAAGGVVEAGKQGATGACPGVWPCSGKKTCPSGNRGAS